jgi:hypothetical protein
VQTVAGQRCEQQQHQEPPVPQVVFDVVGKDQEEIEITDEVPRAAMKEEELMSVNPPCLQNSAGINPQLRILGSRLKKPALLRPYR